jgi:hypothetical protein
MIDRSLDNHNAVGLVRPAMGGGPNPPPLDRQVHPVRTGAHRRHHKPRTRRGVVAVNDARQGRSRRQRRHWLG